MGTVLTLPPPVRPPERLTQQVAVRLRPSEYSRLVKEAQEAGFRSLGEYLRLRYLNAGGPRSAP